MFGSALGIFASATGTHWLSTTTLLSAPSESVVIGKKNRYGSNFRRGLHVAAVFYSLLESGHLASVNPHLYLRAAVNAALDGKPIPLPHEFN